MSHLVSRSSSKIAGLFFVTFNENHGPSILFSESSNKLDISNIQWKAIVSGQHLISSDVIIFSLPAHSLCGIAAYKRKHTTAGRGGVMCSVGVLTNHINSLFKHSEFCLDSSEHFVTQLKVQRESQDSQETDLDLSLLSKYWKTHGMEIREKAPARISMSSFEPSKRLGGGKAVMDLSALDQFPYLTFRGNITCPTIQQHPSFSSLQSFIISMGSNFLTLWKAVMLQKRILFLCPPPVLLGCCAVYWTTQLADTNTISPGNMWANAPRIEYVPTENIYSKKWTRPSNIQPLFNVTLSDLDYISSLNCFIGCTSDEMFREKPNLYDLLVDLRPTSSGALSSTRGLNPSLSKSNLRFRSGSYLDALSDGDGDGDDNYIVPDSTFLYPDNYDSVDASPSSNSDSGITRPSSGSVLSTTRYSNSLSKSRPSSFLSTSSNLSSLSTSNTKHHSLFGKSSTESSSNPRHSTPTLTTPLLTNYSSSSPITNKTESMRTPRSSRPSPTLFIPNSDLANILKVTASDILKKQQLSSLIRQNTKTVDLLNHIGDFNNPIFNRFPSALLLQDPICPSDVVQMGLKIPFSPLGIPFCCFCKCFPTDSFCVQCWLTTGTNSDLPWIRELMRLWSWDCAFSPS